MSLLGVDVGTSAVKAAVFRETGEVLAVSSVAHVRRPGCDDDNELPAETFWDSFVAAVREAASGADTDRVTAMAVSAHGETIIPLDEHGRPCAPALLNRDHRSAGMISAWEDAFGRAALYSRTGLPAHAMYSLPKLGWMRKERPEAFARASRFSTVAGFLLLCMGMSPVTDPTLAARTMGFDITRRKWAEDLLQFAGLSPRNVEEVAPSATVVGRLDAAHARALCLEPGVSVCLGGHDQPCGAFGAGATAPGTAVDSAGSYECVTVVSGEPGNTPRSLASCLNSGPHVVPGLFITLGFFAAGLVVAWMRAGFFDAGPSDERSLAALEREVERLGPEPTGICMTPHLIGSINPHWDMRASLSASGIRAHHGRYHLYKALWEGIACELRANLQALSEATGPISRLTIFGGGSRWDEGVQIRADVTDRTLHRAAEAQMVCRGAALLAGWGAGVYRTPEEAVTVTRPTAEEFAPRPRTVPLYHGQASRYDALYAGLDAYRTQDGSGAG